MMTALSNINLLENEIILILHNRKSLIVKKEVIHFLIRFSGVFGFFSLFLTSTAIITAATIMIADAII